MDRSLPPPSPFQAIDAKRIAGNSLALVIHAVALGILLMPSDWEPAARPPRENITVVTEYVPPEEIVLPEPPPLPIEPVTEPRQPTAISPPILQDVAVATTEPVLDTGTLEALPTDVGPPVVSFDPGPPQMATLAYDVHPAPRYPRPALTRGLTGKVTLKVLVDEQGWPTEVVVHDSSGHPVLDRAARDQVRAKWRFHPAQREGRPVAAYALVPIDFNLP